MSSVPPPTGPPADDTASGTAIAGGTVATERVRAAGGVVWRRLPTGTEVVLVHRPQYDDWGLPKGKVKPVESDEEAALREVREETGLRCRLGAELPSTTYPVEEGRLKAVRYWAMTVAPGPDQRAAPLAPSPEGQGEVDEACWAPLAQARQRLTYARDVVVLDALEHVTPVGHAWPPPPQGPPAGS